MTAAVTVPRQRAPLAGYGILLRLAVHRDRIIVPASIVVLVAMVPITGGSVASLYGTQAQRDALLASAGANDAFRLLLGPFEHAQSVASAVSWRIGLFMVVALGVVAALAVVRHTRKEEELGRLELVRAGRVGALAPLAVGITAGAVVSAATGILMAVAIGIQAGADLASSVAFGVQFAATGFAATGLAGVTAQVATSARTANTLAAGAIVAGYALRGAADVDDGLRWLVWASPVGWAQRIDPFGANAVLPALACVLAGIVAAGLAVRLQLSRDIDSGLIRPRPGPPTSTTLTGPFAVLLRTTRASIASWTITVGAYCLLVGFLLSSVDDIAGDSDQMRQLVETLGGSSALSDSFQAIVASFVGLAAAAWTVTLAVKLHADENAGRTEAILATRVSRARLFGAATVLMLLGVTAIAVVSGLAMGVAHAISAGDWGDAVRDGVVAGAVQIPAAAVVGAVALTIYAWRPRAVVTGWAVIVAILVVSQFGELLSLPQWLRDISPFSHVPMVPVDDVDALPLVTLAVVAAVLVASGFAGFRRRDVPV
ncbi:ABC transporter permease [Rhodococcus sp. HNM0569]|uniref:ABC transporter permease n=1 Tax=Rhodococcus sp. HNM0569 TaxID=2716340 RepID=UPI00146C3593|nr:ABC transporter permease [Rhodococcus sp. HNM0569]NLU84995.1 ABC transporter permease [Rhodococcus sp. HNM0569]